MNLIMGVETATISPGASYSRLKSRASNADAVRRGTWMTEHRSLYAGLGTAGSLVAAIAAAFLIAGGVIAYSGWPELDAPASNGTLIVAPAARADAPPVVVATRSARPSGGSASTPRTSRSTRRGQATRGATERATVRARLPAGSPPGAPEAPSQGTSVNARPATQTGSQDQSPAPTPASSLADGAERATSDLGSAVSNVTRGVGDTVGGPVGQTVTSVGDTLGNTVASVGGTVSDVLRILPILGRSPRG
jgi:hypothetical protein